MPEPTLTRIAHSASLDWPGSVRFTPASRRRRMRPSRAATSPGCTKFSRCLSTCARPRRVPSARCRTRGAAVLVKAFRVSSRCRLFTSNAQDRLSFGVPFTSWDDPDHRALRNRADPKQPFFAVFIGITHEFASFRQPAGRETARHHLAYGGSTYTRIREVREELAACPTTSRQDGQVGEILNTGATGGDTSSFWSDHGDGVPRAKRSLYDSGLRVPLMIRWPKTLGPGSGAAPGSVRDELVSFIDLAPTVLALAGVPIPTHLQGRVLAGPHAAPAPDLVFAARDRMDIEYDMMRSARNELPYIRNFAPEPYAGHIITGTRAPSAGVVPAAGRAQADGARRLVDANANPAEEPTTP